MGVTPFVSRSSSSDDGDGNDFVYLSSVAASLRMMLKKERHLSAQHSPTAERAKSIQNSVRRVSFLSAFVVVVLARRDFDGF